jgi:oligopeptide/dipeptide ABC transporter ATP-binding protein
VTGSPLLEVSELSVSFPHAYGDIAVLDDVSLSLSGGEALGLVGESGSGKTLLGSMILGLLPDGAVVAGSVALDGHAMLALSREEESQVRGRVVSLVSQDALSGLNPNRRVGAHFRDLWRAAGLRPRDGWRASAIDVLDRVSLREPDRMLRRFPDELSGGMRQRVLIALAVFRQPRLLVADEPTTALDRVTADDVLELLAGLRREMDMAMLFVSHDLATVRRVCDRVAVMYAGQVCEVGEQDLVLGAPAHRYTEALIESARSLRRAEYPVATIQGIVPTPSDFAHGCRFRDRCGWAGADCAVRAKTVSVSGHVGWCLHPPGRNGRG